jgi:hypothetical protein
MTDRQDNRDVPPKPRNLRPIGFVITSIWLLLAVAWILSCSTWATGSSPLWDQCSRWAVQMKANEWGDVFAGVFAPIAFAWLVLGFLQQGDELRLQVHELQESVDQQRKLVEVGNKQHDESKAASARALAASTVQTEMLLKTERPYLTGGGDISRIGGGKLFRLEVANYGKTPAYLSDFDIQFVTLGQAQAGLLKVCCRHQFDDRIAPGPRPKVLGFFPVPDGSEVVYGAFWYRDLQKHEHIFRFILRFGPDGHTRTDVPKVDDNYSFWD